MSGVDFMNIFNKLIGFTLVFIATIAFFSTVSFADDPIGIITPIHTYNFDNDNGTIIVDSVTSGAINGTANGTTIITGYGGAGSARHFNGTNDYLSFDSALTSNGEKSIRLKVRSTIKPPQGSQYLFFDNSNTEITKNGWYSVIGSDGLIYIEMMDSSGTWNNIALRVHSTTSVIDGQWHDILFTWDGTTNTNEVKLYVDDMTTPQVAAASKRAEVNSPTYNFKIGYSKIATAKFFNGDLDQYELYNRDISANAPTNLTSVTNNNKIQLSWTPASDATTATTYIIKRREDGQINYTTLQTLWNQTSYIDIDSSLMTGKTYYYVVQAVNAMGIGSLLSNEVSVVPEIHFNNGILEITLTNGQIKEYDMTAAELQNYLTWYDNRSEGTGKSYFKFIKKCAVKPFISRIEYISFDKISNFEVKEYAE